MVKLDSLLKFTTCWSSTEVVNINFVFENQRRITEPKQRAASDGPLIPQKVMEEVALC